MKITIGSEGMGRWGSKIIEYLLSKLYPNIKIEYKNIKTCDFVIQSHFFNQKPCLE